VFRRGVRTKRWSLVYRRQMSPSGANRSGRNQLGAYASGAGTITNHIMDMTSETLSYHEARAEEELRRAERATTAGAVRAHVALAEMHLDIVYREQPPADSDLGR